MIPNNSNIVDISSYKDKNGNVIVQSPQSYFKQPYYIEAMYDEKVFKSFVTCVEKEIRRSDEYARYLGHLRSMGLNGCAILNNIQNNDEELSKLTIEFHHYPFTLYDIVSIVTEEMLSDETQYVSSFLVAQKVLQLHFDNKVGLVPLCKTVHELAHAGEIFINLNLVYGYYDKFIEEYDEFIDDDYKNQYNMLVRMTKDNKPYSESDILALKQRAIEEEEELQEIKESKKSKVTKEKLAELLDDDEDEEE
jgi:hypothetical protein